ncbi:unnamed protein product, partial [marine sediment metagenome]
VGINAGDVSGFSNIVGSTFVAVDRNFSYSIAFTVTVYAAGVITLNADLGFALTGQTFWLLNDEDYISSDQDWIWRSNVLKISSTVDPSTLAITKTTEDIGLNVTGSGCSISNINMSNYFQHSVYIQASNLTISACNIHDSRGEGLYGRKQYSNLNILDSTFERIANQGMWLSAITTLNILRCTVTDIGMGLNVGWNNHLSDSAEGFSNGKGVFITVDQDNALLEATNIIISY